MTSFSVSLLALLVLVALVDYSEGHGYLLQPPGRGSAWRQGFKTPADYNDNGYNCGGKGVQHNAQNNHRCGVCGNEYSSPRKSNEPGPGNRFASGMIVAKYQPGQIIDVAVMATAFHKGYYEFRLCQNDVPQKGRDASIAVTQDCMNKNVLTSPTGSTKFKATPLKSNHRVKLPDGVECSNCVFQWRYRAGNSWGCEGKRCGNGYGYQEEFWSCADVSIGRSGKSNNNNNNAAAVPEVTTTAETEQDTTQPSRVTGQPPQRATPPPRPVTQRPRQTTRLPRPQPPQPARPNPPSQGRKVCQGVAPYGAKLNAWCNNMCNYLNPYCPRSHCKCT